MATEEDELREIKREIVESRSLVIKTNNLTSSLAADLKSISKKQLGFERRVFYVSAAGYGIFVTALLGVMYVAWNARVDSDRELTARANADAKTAKENLVEVRKELDTRVEAETGAAAFYDLVRAGRKREVIERFDEVRKLPLTRSELAFFTDSVENARNELSATAYQQGLEHERAQRWSEASIAFEEALKLKPNASHTPAAKLELSRSYRKLGLAQKAIPIISELTQSSPDESILDDATMLLAGCEMDLQDWDDARATLKSFLRRFPHSRFTNDAQMALADVNLKH